MGDDAWRSSDGSGQDVLTEWLGENLGDLVDFSLSEFTGSSVVINLSNLKNEASESSTNTLDDSEGELYLVLSVHVGVLHTDNVVELVCFRENKCSL